MDKAMMTFSPARRQRLRVRAARTRADFDILWERLCDDLAERLAVINRRFPRILCLGGSAARLARALQPDLLVAADLAVPDAGVAMVCAEDLLPFTDGAFDLVVSLFGLQTVDDLPGTLVQVRRVLAPDGLFMAALPGGASLWELKECLLRAELEQTAAAAQRVGPTIDLQQAAGLLQRAGFAMPVADLETVAVSYADPLALLSDIRRLGESNPILRARPLRRDVLATALQDYRARHAGPDGRIPVTLEVIHLMGWAPGPDQPQPKARGSARISLAEALHTLRRTSGK
ncbi:MAG: methyltransferase domain-containing protein [Sphingomonadales bacterium]|nr:MAG: methyltransferase domain-containing protein [Sphingomonadales bacterium]